MALIDSLLVSLFEYVSFAGPMIAIVLAWNKTHSVLWTFVDGFFGWFYVVAALVGVV
jgi:hypothetical protein